MSGWKAVEELGLPAGEVEQSRSVLAGLAARAGMQEPLVGRARLDDVAAATATAALVDRAGAWLSAGIDRLVAGPYWMRGRFPGVSFSFLPGFEGMDPNGDPVGNLDDPIRFGRSDICTFSPTGRAWAFGFSLTIRVI